MFAILIFVLLSITTQLKADHGFDVRHHLSTVTTYDVVKDIVKASANSTPDGCTLSTKPCGKTWNSFPYQKANERVRHAGFSLEELIKDAEEQNLSLEKVPSWLRGWKSPWRGKLKGGELIRNGEEEMIRERFPELFEEEYHPDIPRASASAVAFGMGLLSEKGSLGDLHDNELLLLQVKAVRPMFSAQSCYDAVNFLSELHVWVQEEAGAAVDKLKEPVLDEITSALVSRYGLNFTRQDVAMLWFLCKQVALLEWTDDLEMFILKGYVPLLEDVVQSMEQAIKAKEGNYKLSNAGVCVLKSMLLEVYEKARLRFAHAETVVPFSCLLGLFLDGSEFQKIQREEPLELPPKPPQSRNWRGRTVAPFAGNNMLVLHSCPSNSESKYFVQVLHNEHPILMAGCGSDFCPFEEFKEKIVAPHLKHDYNSLCTVHLEAPEQKPVASKLSQLFRWLFSMHNDDTSSSKDDL
ncbi:LOW QUALITY PROTEIN: multiple inositol polyphosphate phosphatase 1-like isoform X1 [Populus alba x Populus x berolinensis]|nr:LOW QUALITY PROTEIN: multiple inositol polyphosphate phosphatase 1-like isoform X1 [Populus alba x Populus x berolinensis]